MCIVRCWELVEVSVARNGGGRKEREGKGDPGVARKCSIVLQLSRSTEDSGGGKRAFLIFFFMRKRV